MKTKKMATAAGVRRVVAYADPLASLLQFHPEALGLNRVAALDLATRLDGLSSYLAKRFAAELADEKAAEEKAEEKPADEKPAKEASRKASFAPASIAKEVPGPIKAEGDEPFMAGHFTQANFNQLSGKQISGTLGAVAALAQKAAFDAAAAVYATAGLRLSSDEKPAEEKAEEKPAKEADEKAPEAKADEKTPEEDEAEKTASLFGLFS